MTEAFVYEWTNQINGMKYIGYHKGDTDDGYVTSATNVNLWKDYWHKKSNFNREIIARGTALEMLELEHKMLKEVNAKDNPKYYNKSNGGIYKKDTDMAQINFKLINEIYDGIYARNHEMRETNEIYHLPRFQTRDLSVDQKKVKQIAELMVLADNTDNIAPIIIIEIDEDEQILDGNHTINAARKVGIPEVKVITITFSELENNIVNVIALGNIMNKPGVIKTPPNTASIKHSLSVLKTNGQNISDPTFKKHFGESVGRTVASIGKIVSIIYEEAETDPTVFRTWAKDELQAEQAAYQERNPDAEVQFSATGSTMEYRVVATIMRDMLKNNKTRGIALLHHSKPKFRDAFDMKAMRELVKHYGIDITFVELSSEPV